jgi:hypothetical protein
MEENRRAKEGKLKKKKQNLKFERTLVGKRTWGLEEKKRIRGIIKDGVLWNQGWKKKSKDGKQ